MKGIKYAKKHVKCDCGHYAKDHYLEEGWCHHSEHPRAGGCGCTWYHPNVHWIKKQKAEALRGKEWSGIRIVRLISSVILSIGIAVGVVLGLVYVIPIQGVVLALIVAPVATIVGTVSFIIMEYQIFRR